MTKLWIIASCALTLLMGTGVSLAMLPFAPEEALIFGRRLDLQASMSGVDIYALDIRTHREILLVESALEEGYGTPDFVISPDGTRIFFGAYAPRDCGYCIHHIETGIVTSTSSAIAIPMSTVWSHDSRYIVYSSLYVEPSGAYLFDTETKQARLVVQTNVSRPSISPDGRHIAVVYNERILTIIDSATGETRFQLSGAQYNIGDELAVWSPDGSALAFRGFGIYLVDSHLETVTLLTPAAHADLLLDDDSVYYSAPFWSPDGTHVVYSGLEYSSGTQALYVSDVRTLEQRRLAEGTHPVWSPNGHWIAFLCRAGTPTVTTNSDVCIIHPDGSDLRQLTDTNLAEVYPQWLP